VVVTIKIPSGLLHPNYFFGYGNLLGAAQNIQSYNITQVSPSNNSKTKAQKKPKTSMTIHTITT
jgi:hypothetical protein